MGQRRLTWLGILAAVLIAAPARAADDADPFTACKATPDLDEPVIAKRVSRTTLSRMAKALKLQMTAREIDAMREAFYWRCMNADVYVCFVGANIPCWSKADTSRTSDGATTWCAEHPNEQFVPAYATGHETVWLWGCDQGRPVIRNADVKLDPRGFSPEMWVRLDPPRKK
jgi:hypothetical protein